MAPTIDYYFAPQSPWTHLGHLRFWDIARRHGAAVRVLPVDLPGRVFPSSGGLPLSKRDTGYGHTSGQVDAVQAPPELLLEYYEAVHRQTVNFLENLGDDDFDRIVDTRWDPPVTLGVRLVSIADDCLQHAGQASYVRGLLPT